MKTITVYTFKQRGRQLGKLLEIITYKNILNMQTYVRNEVQVARVIFAATIKVADLLEI